MKRSVYGSGRAVLGLALSLTATMAWATCPPDAVRSGDICMDKFEASVWRTDQRALIKEIRHGAATLQKLKKTGAVQLGLVAGDLEAAGCLKTGNGCTNVFAVSIPGVIPAREINWFQAAAAARNSWKRLPTNAEWQATAFGTPDPGTDDGATDCNIGGPPFAVAPTGSRSKCVSDAGAFDMVGNLIEWVADWVPLSTADCAPSLFPKTGDINCFAGVDPKGGPAALIRSGSFESGALAGVFTISGLNAPSAAFNIVGFRAARALGR